MTGLIGFRFAVNFVLCLLVAVFLYHLLILAEVIPYHTAWGGRLENVSQMRVFESISIAVNLLIVFVVTIKGGYLKIKLSEKLINGILWLLVALFTINTIGNIFAQSLIEAIVATPLTLMSAILFYRMTQEKSSTYES